MKTQPNSQSLAFTRRTFLRGVGATMALPFMESLVPRWAFAAPTTVQPPVRMGIFTVTGGTVPESWVPNYEGALEKMPSILRSLDPLKEDVMILSGLSQNGKADARNAHEYCAALHLTAGHNLERKDGKLAGTVSIDQKVAEALAEHTVFPSLQFGTTNQETKFSYRSNGVPVPYENNPRTLFDTMFRDRPMVAPNWARRQSLSGAGLRNLGGNNGVFDYDQSVVDVVLSQAKDLRRKLGRADQEKFDEFLESVHSIENRLERLQARVELDKLDMEGPGPSQLHPPADLKEAEFYREQWFKNAPTWSQDTEIHAEYIRLFAEMMVLAFQTDTTRVVTFAAGSDGALFPGVVTVGNERHAHTLEHNAGGQNPDRGDPIAREGCRQIHAWYTELFSEFVAKMKTIDEGGTSLLDNSMILYTSYMADGGHGRKNYPALLAGRAGGTLKPGRHIAYEKHTPVANLYVEMMERMGLSENEFGENKKSEKAQYEGRLPDLV